MKHSIGLVTYGSYVHAWVLDLPGCLVGGRDLDQVAHMLPVVIAEHAAWLRSHGETVGESGAWEVAQTVDVAAAPGGDPCFDAERTPLARRDLDRLIARMEYARADLLDGVRQLPDAVLDWEPPASAIGSFDAWAPGVRTIRDIVRHVFQFEVYYRDGLRDGAAKGIFEKVADPAIEGARTVDLLRSLTEEDRGRVYQPIRPAQTVAEEWTARKVLRRIISHERAHAAEIQQRRTWLLLGVPDLTKAQ